MIWLQKSLSLGFFSLVISFGASGIFNSKNTRSIYKDIFLPKKISAQAICDVQFNDPNLGSNSRQIGDKKVTNQLLKWELNLEQQQEEDKKNLKEGKTISLQVTDIPLTKELKGPSSSLNVSIRKLDCKGTEGNNLSLSQIPPLSVIISLQNCFLETTGLRKCFLKAVTNKFEWSLLSLQYS